MTDDVMRELESDELLDMLPKEIPPHEEVTKEGDDPMNEAYFTEVDRDGCSHCGEGRQWRVVGPDGMADSVCYDYEPDAERHAESLNAAFDQGVRSTNARISALTAENERLKGALEKTLSSVSDALTVLGERPADATGALAVVLAMNKLLDRVHAALGRQA